MKYYVFRFSTNSLVTCDSFEEMIEYFAYFNTTGFDIKRKTNSVLEDIAMNPNDKRPFYTWFLGETQRDIMVFDEDNRTIDPRIYKEQILNYEPKYRPWRRYKKWETYEFRRGPVPNIHCYRGHRGSYYRHPQTTQERTLSVDKEMKEYVRPNRNYHNLPNTWDEIPRHYDKSWKNKKIKKQWMKNLPKHMDTIHNDYDCSIEGYEDIDFTEGYATLTVK